MYILEGVDVVEMGQIKVFIQELGLKQGFLADTNMDHLIQSGLGPQILKLTPISICSLKLWVKTFKMSYGRVRYLRNCPNAGLLHYFLEWTRKMGKKRVLFAFRPITPMQTILRGIQGMPAES